jgi:hypothetical protein
MFPRGTGVAEARGYPGFLLRGRELTRRESDSDRSRRDRNIAPCLHIRSGT